MGLFDKLFGKKTNEKQNEESEQAVIVRFNYGIQSLDPLHKFEKILEKIIIDKNVGEYDGHEIAVDYSDGILYMYGPNAEILFKTIKDTLEKTTFMKGAVATIRFGPPEEGVSEISITI